MRFGLCCLFKDEEIAFRTTTAKVLSVMPRGEQLNKLSGICHSNTQNLLRAVQTVHRLGIGAFRIMSPLFPRMTHPDVGYTLDDLPDGDAIANLLCATRSFAQLHDIRLSFHPDQFVVLSSPHPAVVANSMRELEYQAWLAEAVGADVINLHAGGVYGDKSLALMRFCQVFADLPENVRSRLTLENDDVSYTVSDLLPVCEKLSIPLGVRCPSPPLQTGWAVCRGGDSAGRCHLAEPWKGAILPPCRRRGPAGGEVIPNRTPII